MNVEDTQIVVVAAREVWRGGNREAYYRLDTGESDLGGINAAEEILAQIRQKCILGETYYAHSSRPQEWQVSGTPEAWTEERWRAHLARVEAILDEQREEELRALSG